MAKKPEESGLKWVLESREGGTFMDEIRLANSNFWTPDNLNNVIDRETFTDTAFVAGGALPLCFGVSDNQIWTKMTESAQESRLNIAGIEFSLAELEQMGYFYRWLSGRGKVLRCIDERLDEEINVNAQVHCECGACNAVKAATSSAEDIEALLASQQGLSEQDKQPLLPGMPNHKAMTILIGLGPKGEAVKPDLRNEQKTNGTLAFNVSLPLELIGQYCKEQNVDQKALLTTLIRWNVQIARNIIGGNHNDLQELANDTIVAVETARQSADDFIQLLTNTVTGVSPDNVRPYSLTN